MTSPLRERYGIHQKSKDCVLHGAIVIRKGGGRILNNILNKSEATILPYAEKCPEYH